MYEIQNYICYFKMKVYKSLASVYKNEVNSIFNKIYRESEKKFRDSIIIYLLYPVIFVILTK